MKVCVSVKGRFHAFQLAYALQKNAALTRLITSYPMSHTKRYHLEKSLVSSLIVNEMMNQAWGRFAPYWLKRRFDPAPLLCTLYDNHAAKLIPENTDLFVGFSSCALHSLKKAKESGIKTVLERCSAHIITTKEIYEEEYQRLNYPIPHIVHQKIIDRELAEYALADFVCVPSSFAKKTFLERGFAEEKLIQIPYGVALDHFYPSPKKDNVFRVIYAGSSSIRKGVHYLLQAFTELNLPNSELWLVGSVDPEFLPFLKKYQSDRVHLKGSQPEFLLHEFYSQGSVFCQPSLQDGFSLVIPQAMACGLPVICSKNTAGNDIIRENIDGFTFQIRNIDTLKEKILYFYEHPEASKAMGESARQHISSGFSWLEYEKNILSSYQRLLS